MRIPRILLTSAVLSFSSFSAANAADAVYGEPSPPPYAPMMEGGESGNWTGAYLGVFGGAATGDFEYESTDATDESRIVDEMSGGGLFGGAQAGYDFQIGNAVVGAVADIAATDIESNVTVQSGDGISEVSTSASSSVKYLGTVRGRAGYGMDRTMVYGHGGLAYGKTELEHSETERSGGSSQTNRETSSSDTKYGYVVGAGVEYMATEQVSIQTEYGYHDLGQDKIYESNGLRIDEDVDFHAVKAGVNFRF